MNENSINPNKEDVLIPLKYGNYWIYKNTIFNYGGSDTNRISYDTIRVDGIRVLNNETYYFYDGNLMINRNDGLYYSNSYDYSLLYKYPANKGDYFENYYDDSVSVISNDSLISINSNTFNCYVYHWLWWNNNGQIQSSYTEICPGIGVIRQFQFDFVNSKETKLINLMELLSYHLK